MLAHASRLVCESLRTALSAQPGLYVVGSATTADQMRFLLPHTHLLLLAAALQDAPALSLLEELRTSYPQVKVLVLGTEDDPEHIIRFLEAGAAGYILQGDSVATMVDKLRAANDEKAVVSTALAAAMIARLASLANMQTPPAFVKSRRTQLDELTDRQQEVLGLLAEGCSNREIADRLFIEYGTVKNHVHSLMKKLEVRNRYEAASLYTP